MRKTRSLILLAMRLSMPPAGACPIYPEPKEIENAAKDEQYAGARVKALSREADAVFTGRVESVEEREKPLAADPVPDELYPPMASVRGEVPVSSLKILKGKVGARETYVFERANSIEFSCSATARFHEVLLRPTFRDLFHVRDGKILRANEVVDWFHTLDVDNELRLLES